VGIGTIIRYRWFFLAVAVTILGIGLWIIYLRYLLAKRAIDSQTEIEKFRLQLTAGSTEPVLQLTSSEFVHAAAGAIVSSVSTEPSDVVTGEIDTSSHPQTL
jgi:hypothetical protein